MCKEQARNKALSGFPGVSCSMALEKSGTPQTLGRSHRVLSRSVRYMGLCGIPQWVLRELVTLILSSLNSCLTRIPNCRCSESFAISYLEIKAKARLLLSIKLSNT